MTELSRVIKRLNHEHLNTTIRMEKLIRKLRNLDN